MPTQLRSPSHAPLAASSGNMELDVRLELACDEAAPGAVRTAMRGMAGIGWILGDAMLVASELVTNAVLHSGASAQDKLRIVIQMQGERLLISVRDPGFSGTVPRLRDTPDAFGGMGLRLVDELSEDWGAELDKGRHVWARLAVPAQA